MQSVTKRCIFCQKEVIVMIDRRLDALDEKLLQEKEGMCYECARARGLDPTQKYFAFAGSFYQKFGNAHLKICPVGTFH